MRKHKKQQNAPGNPLISQLPSIPLSLLKLVATPFLLVVLEKTQVPADIIVPNSISKVVSAIILLRGVALFALTN